MFDALEFYEVGAFDIRVFPSIFVTKISDFMRKSSKFLDWLNMEMRDIRKLD